MNDRYKYRVWDKENKCLHYPTRYSNFAIVNGTVVKIESYPTANSAYLGKRIAWEFDDAVVMQCTGLKDKNSKLIYEGDIVKEYYYNTKETAIKKTIFDENICGYAYTDGIEYNSLCFSDCRRLEVIGNIYENKDLLNESISNS